MAPEPASPRRRRSGWRIALVASAATVAVAAGAAAVLWTQRAALGARLVTDALARRGVPAAVHITRLDPSGAEGSLVVGPAGDPDLVVPHLRVDLAAWPPPGGGAPRVTGLTLERARLKARWDGRRLTFGALQPLVEDALRAKPGGAPAPAVTLRDGQVDIVLPQGRARVAGDAALRDGRLSSASLRLSASRLEQGGVDLRDAAGAVKARSADGRLEVRLDLAARTVSAASARLATPRLQVEASLPYNRDAQSLFDGRVTADATLVAAALRSGDVRLEQARLDGRFDGVLDRGGEHAVGDADLALRAATAASSRGEAQGLTLRVAAANLDAAATRGAPVGRAPFTFALRARQGATRLADARLRLADVELSGRGRAALRRDLRLQAELGGSATAGLDAEAAARWAQAAAPAGWSDLRTAMAAALRDAAVAAPRVELALGDGVRRVALAAPAKVDARSGARLTLAQANWREAGGRGRGEMAATLAGGGLPRLDLAAPDIAMRGETVSATAARVALDGSAGPLREARAALLADAAFGDGVAAVRARRCSNVSLGAYLGDDGAPLARDLRARLCPAATPLLQADRRGWRLAVRLPAAAVDASATHLAVTGAAGDLQLSGRGGAWGGALRLAAAHLRDTATPVRFAPLDASGTVRLSQREADAALEVALARPQRALGPLHLVQSFADGAGALTLEAPSLSFDPQGLQPAAILPALAPFGTEVRGNASAALHMRWDKAGATGGARFTTAGLDLKSSAGPVKGLSTDLVIASLDPLTTAPGQVVRAQALQTLLPLSDIGAVVQLTPQALELASAQATLGGGRVSLDRMRVPLTPDATITGVVRAQAVHVAPLLDAVNLSRALKLEAVLDGVLPFSLSPQGLRFTKGELAATGPGRLTLVRSALTGVATDGGPAGAPPSAAQDFAFQALEDLAFSALDARVDSRDGGRLGVLFHIKGRHDPPVGRPARVSLLDLLHGRAFDKEIPLPKGTEVDLTLDTSLNFDDLYKAYLGLGRRPAGASSAEVQP